MTTQTHTRPVYLTREGSEFRLAFAYHPQLVAKARALPGARFDADSKTWTAAVATQTVDALRTWHREGLCDPSPDDLLKTGETLEAIPAATLLPGSRRRPYRIVTNIRDEQLYSRLRALPGAAWDKSSHALTCPATAGGAISELVDRGVVADPSGVLTPFAVAVGFDGRNGEFFVRGDDRAAAAFTASFPDHDVVSVWIQRGIDAGFLDELTEQTYHSARARNGSGLQPEGLTTDLYPYQAQTVAVSMARVGTGIFHEMGLGKTVIGIAVGLETVTNRKAAERTVCIVPGAVRTQWADEIKRFTGQDDIVVISGSAKQRRAGYEAAANCRWLIVHYDVITIDLEHIDRLARGNVVVFDEAHRLKNPTAKRTKSSRTIARHAAKRLALTGTPIINDPSEWYSIIGQLVEPGSLGSPSDFLGRYSYKNRWGGYEGARRLPELRARSAMFYMRSTKAEVAPWLPPLRVQLERLDVDAAYRNVLRQAHRNAAEEIKTQAFDRVTRGAGVLAGDLFAEAAAGAEMTAVGMLRLLCLSPELIWRSDAPSAKALCDAGLVPQQDGPKIDEMRVRAAELQANGTRAVCFTSSKRMANLLSERLTTDGIRHVTYTGDTTHEQRDQAVKAFRAEPTEAEPGPTIFLATDAAGEGLNLDAQCSLVINLDVPWTAHMLAQRSGRIHRIDGTAERYLVINLLLSGTVEEGIIKMIERKADIADAVYGDGKDTRRVTGRWRGENLYAQALADPDAYNV